MSITYGVIKEPRYFGIIELSDYNLLFFMLILTFNRLKATEQKISKFPFKEAEIIFDDTAPRFFPNNYQ
jgi:hypothetical protein